MSSVLLSCLIHFCFVTLVDRIKFVQGNEGEVDIDKEHEEMEMRRKLFMMNKKLESLETPKYTVASEFYTQVCFDLCALSFVSENVDYQEFS